MLLNLENSTVLQNIETNRIKPFKTDQQILVEFELCKTFAYIKRDKV